MSDTDIVRELLRRAILTLCAIPDPDARYRRNPQTAWPGILQDPYHAYGAAPPRYRHFHPTAADLSRYLPVLDWLLWYEHVSSHGREAVSLFWARTHGSAWWPLEQRFRKCRTTLYNRVEAMIGAIATRYRDDILLYRIDGLNILNNSEPNHGYGGNCAESDLADLPTSPKAVICAVPEPLSPSAEALAHKLLHKRLQRNRLAAMQRKHTKTAPHALMAQC